MLKNIILLTQNVCNYQIDNLVLLVLTTKMMLFKVHVLTEQHKLLPSLLNLWANPSLSFFFCYLNFSNIILQKKCKLPSA